MTTETVELPPLPKPRTIPEGGVRLERWAANEMYDYARQAVLMERERCARVAEGMADPIDAGWDECLYAVASAIRKG